MTTVSQPSTWTEALEMIENNSRHIRKLALTSPWEYGGSVELVSEPDIASFELQFPRIAGHLCPGYSPEYLAKLGDAIGKNTHLKVLSLRGLNGAPPDVTDASFLAGVNRNTSIRALDLTGANLSDGAVCGILESLGECSNNLAQSLSEIYYYGFRARTWDGIRALKSALRRCTNLEELVITCSDANNGLHFHVIMEAIRHHRLLERLRTPPIGRVGFEALVPALQGAGSILRKLTLTITVDADTERVATVLAKSATLKEINMGFHIVDHGEGWAQSPRVVRFREVFSRAMCDTSTIDGTYFSNHTLERLCIYANSIGSPWATPEGAISFILMNRSSADKRTIAMMKVVRYHPILDLTPLFEWELKLLPMLVDRLESVRSTGLFIDEWMDIRKLRAIYQFIRGMPELVAQRVSNGVCTSPTDLRLWHVPSANRPASARPAGTGFQGKESKWNLRRIMLGCLRSRRK